MYPVECVARGYLTGSGLLDYRATGEVCGIPLPEGLEDGSRLPEPIFTPATKADLGEHDENVSYDAVVDDRRRGHGRELRDLTLAVYARAEGIARERGIILADTKLELGARADGTMVLADEVLTPDSSRFWPAAEWEPGRAQPSYDKQIVRNWLLSPESGWDQRLRRAAAAAAGRGGRADPAAVRRGLRAAHRPDLLSRRAARPRWHCPLRRPCRGGLRLPRRPAPPAGVAVVAPPGRGRRRRAAGRPDLDRRHQARTPPGDGDDRPGPAAGLGGDGHLALRPRGPDPALRRPVGDGACEVCYAFRIHALGPLGSRRDGGLGARRRCATSGGRRDCWPSGGTEQRQRPARRRAASSRRSPAARHRWA